MFLEIQREKGELAGPHGARDSENIELDVKRRIYSYSALELTKAPFHHHVSLATRRKQRYLVSLTGHVTIIPFPSDPTSRTDAEEDYYQPTYLPADPEKKKSGHDRNPGSDI